MPSNSSEACSSLTSTNGDTRGSQTSQRRSSTSSLLQYEWGEFSVVIEMKMNESALVYINCPSSSEQVGDDVEVIKFGEKSIELFQDSADKEDGKTLVKRFGVNFTNIQFEPDTVSGGKWSDRRRFFSCRVNLAYRDFVCGIRRFSDLQAFLANKSPLNKYCERITNNGITVTCSECQAKLLITNDEKPLKFIGEPDLDLPDHWNGLSDYQLHGCAHQHGGHGDKAQSFDESAQLNLVPSNKKAIFTESQLRIRHNLTVENSLILDHAHGVVSCKSCISELGKMPKDNPNAVHLHLSGVSVEDTNMNKNLIEERFHSLERFFAFLLLRHSANESSLKIVFRTCERTPYVLIWLLEPIFVIADGKMKELSAEAKLNGVEGKKPSKVRRRALTDPSLINASSALKVLYKVYDEETAKSDPRANGADSSVSFVDIPHAACMHFEEILLRNSARLPEVSRFLGNFLISFLTIDDE